MFIPLLLLLSVDILQDTALDLRGQSQQARTVAGGACQTPARFPIEGRAVPFAAELATLADERPPEMLAEVHLRSGNARYARDHVHFTAEELDLLASFRRYIR